MLNSQSTKLNQINHTNEEHTLFQSLLEISDEALFVVSATDFSIKECNKVAEKLFEAGAKQDLINQPLFKLYNIQPLDSTIEKLNTVLEEKGKYSQEFSFKTCKQNIFWGKLTQKSIGFANNDYTLVKISKEANYLREEEWLSEVLKITSKVTGRQFFKELTRFLCKTFNSEYAFIARRVADDPKRLKIFYWHGDKIGQYFITIKDSFIENTLHGVTSYYPEVLTEMFPGDPLVQETGAKSFMGTPVFDPSGQTFGVIGVLSSKPMEELPNSRYMLSILSSRAASEFHRISSKELLRQQTRELAEANSMKDRLLSVITSDLHTPITTILGFSEILKRNLEEYTAKQLSGKLTVMDNALRNLEVFLENLSDWNRLVQRGVQTIITNNKLGELIDNTKADYKYLSDLKKINLHNEIDSSIEIEIDAYLMETSIRNTALYLVKNTMTKSDVAFSFKEVDGVKCLKVSSTHFTADINDVKFCLEASIEDLYNASKDSSVPVLGLYIAREFMKIQGGKLNYQLEGEALSFIFTFSE